jgi:hypothetical protein
MIGIDPSMSYDGLNVVIEESNLVDTSAKYGVLG